MGFSRNMQIVLKQNKELLSDRKTYAGGRQSFPKEKHALRFKESDEQSLQELRESLKKEKRIDRLKIISILLLILVLAISALIILI